MSPTKMCSCFPYRGPKMSFSLFSTLVSRLLCTSMEGWLVRRSWWAVTGREQRLIMTLTTCNTDAVTLFICIHTSVPCSMCVCTVHCVCVHTVLICECVYSHSNSAVRTRVITKYVFSHASVHITKRALTINVVPLFHRPILYGNIIKWPFNPLLTYD